MPLITPPETLTQHESGLDLSPRFLFGMALDRSSSMMHIRQQVITGYNGLLKEQCQLTGTARSTLVAFGSLPELLHIDYPITELPLLTPADYTPSGSTALLDGMGLIMERIEDQFNDAPLRRKVLIAILSDGAENISRKFTLEEIISEISFHRQRQGWIFIFLAAGHIAAAYARNQLDLPPECVIDFLAEDVGTLFLKLSEAMRAYRLGQTDFLRLMQ